MTNQTPCNAPTTRSGEPQTWNEDEIDSVSTMSCRTVAAIRAIDAEDPKTAFEEPLAAWLAGDDWLARIRQVLEASGQYRQGLLSDVSMRCVTLDGEVLNACQGSAGIKQVVLLGAGMDTRPYRLDLPDVVWFEVDVAEISRLKQQLIEQVPEVLRSATVVRTQRLECVPFDLTRSQKDLLPLLVERGFDADAPVLYVLEGLVYYLSSDENRELFRSLSAPVGSCALVSCIPAALKTMVNDPAVQKRIPRYRMIAPAWKTDLTAFLDVIDSRWTLAQDVNLFDEAEKREWPLSRDLDITIPHRDVAEHCLAMRRG